MFNKKELLLIREALDAYYSEDKPEKEHHAIMDLRDKCTDLLILQKQWRKKQNLCDIV